MPDDVLIPVLGYPDLAAAVDWLSQAFGFTERWRVGDHRAQLAVGSSAAIALVHDDLPAASRDHVMVRVVDLDAHHAAARAAGAEIVAAPTDFPYGERQYTARDRWGRTWVFTQSVADVAPEDWGGASGSAPP